MYVPLAQFIINVKKGWSKEARIKSALVRKAKNKVEIAGIDKHKPLAGESEKDYLKRLPKSARPWASMELKQRQYGKKVTLDSVFKMLVKTSKNPSSPNLLGVQRAKTAGQSPTKTKVEVNYAPKKNQRTKAYVASLPDSQRKEAELRLKQWSPSITSSAKNFHKYLIII